MRWLLLIVLLFYPSLIHAYLVINEIASNVPRSDWVELYFISEERLSMDISSLYVTMYYGVNEPLAQSPVTIYSWDRAETPWDDRFVVVHLTAPGFVDEDDAAGDTNGNGILDVYCNNYSNSLWNSDCVVAIDTDDDPSNGGIIDCAAYSNNDGTLNQSITEYLNSAVAYGQWAGAGDQGSMIPIGANGLLSYQCIIRKAVTDTNTAGDFIVSPYQTPGRINVLPADNAIDDFIKVKRKIVISKKSVGPLSLFVLKPCRARVRLFSTVGRKVYESALVDMQPGFNAVNWERNIARLRNGLYLGTIEAQDSSRRQRIEFYCIVVE